MNRAYVVWTDSAGNTRLVWYSYYPGGSLPTFAAAIDGCANPTPSQIVSGEIQVGTGTPSNNPYSGVGDSAVLQFVTTLGSLVGVVVPGFKESLYLEDNQTVDPAQPLVIALVSACIGFIVDAAGSPVVNYVGGLRQKRGY